MQRQATASPGQVRAGPGRVPFLRRLLLVALLSGCGSAIVGVAPTAEGSKPGVEPLPTVEPKSCGSRTDRRGLTTRTLEAGGLTRTYQAYVPRNASPTQPMPLVYVHHGYTMSGQLMFDITRYAELAEAEGIVLAFPDGQGGATSLEAPWNVGEGVCDAWMGAPPVAAGDDFALLDAIRADLSGDQCIDERHVFATGFSMGGYFANHAACMRDDIRAIAPHSAGTHDLSACSSGPKPVILFHGNADNVIPMSCGRAAADAWAKHNGCSTATTSREVQGGSCLRYEGCPADGQVELCTFTLMGHCWAGGSFTTGLYSCPIYADATRLGWEFFKQFAW